MIALHTNQNGYSGSKCWGGCESRSSPHCGKDCTLARVLWTGSPKVNIRPPARPPSQHFLDTHLSDTCTRMRQCQSSMIHSRAERKVPTVHLH